MKVKPIGIQINQTSFSGGWYKPHRMPELQSRPDFDKKTLERIEKLTKDKIKTIAVLPSSSTLSFEIILKDKTEIIFSQTKIKVKNKTDEKGDVFTTFHDLRQDPESGVLPNIIDNWRVECDYANHSVFSRAYRRLSELFSDID